MCYGIDVIYIVSISQIIFFCCRQHWKVWTLDDEQLEALTCLIYEYSKDNSLIHERSKMRGV